MTSIKHLDNFPALLSIILSNGIETDALNENGRKSIYYLFAGKVENPSVMPDIAFIWGGVNQTVQGKNQIFLLNLN